MAVSYTRGFSPADLMAKLFSRSRRMSAQMAKVAEQGANDIRDLSEDNAPVDEGWVEKSLKVRERTTKADNIIFDVYVDESVADVAEYVDMLHEGIMRGKPYKLGDKSIDKAKGNKDVGPKFMERAFKELKPKIIEEYKKAMKENW